MHNIEVEDGSGNVYEDLGIENPEEMLLKGYLTVVIKKLIASKDMTPEQAAGIAGLPSSELSMILKGHFQDTSVPKMLWILIALGEDIRFSIGSEPNLQFQLPPRHARAVNE